MRIVSYTRTTSCFPGDEIPANVITEQNDRIKEFAEKHEWKISEKYSDRKKDPTENSAFEKLLEDGIQRKFDAVIIDSLFRAGKDLWSAREVLLQTFHYAGIGFIIVEDDYVSIGKTNEEAEAYFDEKYGLLRRENIRHRVNERNRKGILSWNDVKYGYRLTDDYQLVIDEETAPVVRRMFEMCAEGMTPKQIAEQFTTEKIPIPLVSRGMNVKIDDPYKWDRLKVRRLLDKTVYIGHWSKVVQGEVMEFTNEPIVDEEIFEMVQKYLQSIATNAKPPRKKHQYNRLICDNELGFCIRLRKSRTGVFYFAFAATPKDYEGPTQLLLSDLEAELRNELNQEKKRAEKIAELIRTAGEEKKTGILSQMRDEFKDNAYVLSEYQQARMEKYKQFGSGEISEEDMNQAEEEYQRMSNYLEKGFHEYPEEVERVETALSEENPWLQLFMTWDINLPFDSEVLHKYVSCITLDHMRIASIEFPHAEWYKALPKDWRD